MKYMIMNTEMTKATSGGYKTQIRKAITNFFDLSLDEPKKHPISFKDMPKDLEFKSFQGFGNPCPMFYSKKQDKHYCSNEIKYNTGEKVLVEMSEILLIIIGVRVEKLKDMSIYDIIKEGCPKQYYDGCIGTKKDTVEWWIELWDRDKAITDYKWNNNPFVIVYEFKKYLK